ncbi:MAG: DUF1353 domain-containing protein [Siphonobacter aquaeclarae]|nr:DUF1353 domain-containing protein [Siphonobacter aquaeclarae]
MKMALVYDTEGRKPDHFRLSEDLILTASDGAFFRIPAGFMTDGASVPGLLQGFVHPIHRDFPADAFHDYHYENRRYYDFSRREIDGYWLEFMRKYNPDHPARTLVKYLYVRALGWWNWRYYA